MWQFENDRGSYTLPDLYFWKWSGLRDSFFTTMDLRISGSSILGVCLEKNVQESKNIKTTFGSMLYDFIWIVVSLPSSFRNIFWNELKFLSGKESQANEWKSFIGH